MNRSDVTNFIDNLYTLSRFFRSAETKPRYYGTDILLYPNEAYTLRAIAECPGTNQTEISQRMHRTKGATSVVVQKLIRKGLAVCKNESIDQRVGCLYATEKGMEVYQLHRDYDNRYLQMISREMNMPLEELELVNKAIVCFMELTVRRQIEHNDDFT